MMKGKLLASIFTTLVIFLLVSTGPVEGFSLNIQTNDLSPERGDTVTFTAEVNIGSNEVLPIERLTFQLEGTDQITCTFDSNGAALDGCTNIRITKTQGTSSGYSGSQYGYGYSYGFTDGKLNYKIEIDTNRYKIGSYSTLFKIKVGNTIYAKDGPIIKVRSSSKSDKQICSAEWTCGEWSPCTSNVQYRTCYRNLNYCETEPEPEQTRVCLSEEPITPIPLSSITEKSQEISPINQLSIIPIISNWENLQFVVILLLMNCIVTLINIIVKVQERFYSRRKKRLPKLPALPKKSKKI